jgi:hypothetical protein
LTNGLPLFEFFIIWFVAVVVMLPALFVVVGELFLKKDRGREDDPKRSRSVHSYSFVDSVGDGRGG